MEQQQNQLTTDSHIEQLGAKHISGWLEKQSDKGVFTTQWKPVYVEVG